MKQWKGFGDQSFDPGITLKEIAKSLEKWNYENIAQFNSCTKDMVGEGYIFAPYKGLNPDGVQKEQVQEMWKWIQGMDKGAYNTINWLMLGKMTLLIIPPPPPPPGDDD